MAKTRTSFSKGDNRKRKPKGALNKTTKEAHELFMFIMNGQVDNIKVALNKVYQDDPEKYINALSKLFQYYMPRKTDITSGDEKIVIGIPTINITTNDS